jgi:hypothetical protein
LTKIKLNLLGLNAQSNHASMHCHERGPVPLEIRSPSINHHHTEIGQKFLGADIHVGVGQRGDADNIGFSDLPQEICQHLVKFIVTDLNALGVLMVFTFIFLSESFAANSSGASGFSIRLAAGVLWTGTRRCISTFAAADEAIGLIGAASSRGAFGT